MKNPDSFKGRLRLGTLFFTLIFRLEAFTPLNTQRSRQFILGYQDGDRNEGNESKQGTGIVITNEWGIPDSNRLKPLASSPVDELPNNGRITLLGSGPGDPDLLTMKAYRLLQDPNIMVIADRLVSEEIMNVIATNDIKIARKLPGCSEMAQEEIYWWVYQGIKQGKHVVRLKIGDPFVFGRGGEEILKFRRFGIESSVVPVSNFDSMEFLLCFLEIQNSQTSFYRVCQPPSQHLS